MMDLDIFLIDHRNTTYPPVTVSIHLPVIMFDLSVNIGNEESIEVVLRPFETQFSSPEQSATTCDDYNGLLQSSVNIRQTRRSSFHFDEVNMQEDNLKTHSVKLSGLETAKSEMAAIDRKIQSLLKKYKKSKSDTSSVKSTSTTPTMECGSLSSQTDSFSDDELMCAENVAQKFTGIPSSIDVKPLGALSLKPLEIK